MKKILLFLLTITIISCNSSTTSETVSTETKSLLDDIKLKDLDGEKMEMKQYKGKTLFINFWATWCKPCITEMPSIVAAQETLGSEDVTFLLVSNEPQNKIKKFVDSHDYEFNYARLDMPLAQLNVQGLPTTLIISPEGNLIFSEMGARDWSLEENINIIREAISK